MRRENDLLQLSPKRLALLAMELQAELEGSQRRAREPIAVVGIGCRFPGAADSPDALWRLLCDGVDAVTEVPPSRFDVEAFYDPDPEAPGRMATRFGAFVDDVEGFDAELFGISPREAAGIDPQQRLLCEVAWEALEHAGQAPDGLDATRTGVFVGVAGSDFQERTTIATGSGSLDAYSASGMAHSVASGRLAYVLGLQGPALSVDTACSSSLVAVHLAVRSLRAGECDAALAGGVNVILSPTTTIALSRAHMMAADGRCKAFDARADGFVRGEGCGLVVLKRLSDAVADGDTVLAVIRGSAVNSDGRSNGLSAPNGPAQEAVLRAALADADAEPGAVGFVEAHGTGTALGDPIEVRALGTVLGRDRTDPLALGSIKTNVGHLEAAAGIAGLIKAVLVVRHGSIPPHLHLTEPSPHIPWGQFPALQVPTGLRRWPAAPRLAGVSSFGFSGTNAHVLVETAPAVDATEAAVPERPAHILPLSAQSPTGVRALAGRYQHAVEDDTVTLADLCHTAGVGRAHLSHRAAVRASFRDEARSRLAALAAGERPPGAQVGEEPARKPRVAFLFPGQGSQHPGMGRELFETQPTFRACLERCDELLHGRLDRSLLSVLYGERERSAQLLAMTAYAQPALFAVEYALADLWRSWGVTPTAVLGHSVGEYAAACVAGVFSLADGLALMAERGRFMEQTSADGRMAAIFAAPAVVEQALAPFAAQLSVAAFNGPEATTVSGDARALDALLERLSAQGIVARRLEVTRGFHSPLIEPALDAFEAVARGVALAAPQTTLVSNLTGAAARDEVADAGYWRRHAREPVRFAAGMAALDDRGCDTFVEVGPQATLLGLGRRCLTGGHAAWLPSLRAASPDWEQLLDTLGSLYVRGVDVDWERFDRDYDRRRVPAPTYPFARERYAVPTLRPGAPHPPAPGGRGHPLLGTRLRVAAIREHVFESVVGPESLPWLRDHRVGGHLIMPSPAYLELAAAAVAQIDEAPAAVVEDLVVHEPLVVPDAGGRTTQVVVDADDGAWRFQVLSLDESADDRQGRPAPQQARAASWRLHASGGVRTTDLTDRAGTSEGLDALRRRCTDEVDVNTLYEDLEGRGLTFGTSFRAPERIFRASASGNGAGDGSGEALALLALPAGLERGAAPYRVHPALLDACLHVFAAALPPGAPGFEQPSVLFGLDRARLPDRPVTRLWCHVRLRPHARPESLTGDVGLFDDEGRRLGALEGVRLRPASPAMLAGTGPDRVDGLSYEVAWVPAPREHAGTPGTHPGAGVRVAEVAERLEREVASVRAAHGLDRYEEFVPRLDERCGAAARAALERLGLQLRPGERIQAEPLAEGLGIAAAHRRLFARLLEMLAEDGVLRETADAWVVDGRSSRPNQPATFDDLLRAYPEFGVETRLVARCTAALAAVLRGEADPLEVLFPGGSLTEAERLYRDSPSAAAFNNLVAAAVTSALEYLPGNRRIRILEVGAGTGGTTAALLPRLAPGRCEYVFTDISPLFVNHARERLAEYPFVRYETLDIASDPGGQGFEPGSFDVVLAANVLHATPDLRRTLAHVRALLAPGGLLVLLEGTSRERFGDLTVGLTEGWWAFDDPDVRPSYALLPRRGWLDLLAAEGFAAPAAVGGDPDSEGLSRQAVVLTTRPTAPQVAEARTWVVFADRGGVGDRVADHLRERGERCALVTPGSAYARLDPERYELDPGKPGDGERLLADVRDAGSRFAGVVHLWSLDVALPPSTAPERDIAEQQRVSVGSVLHVVQALVRAAGADAPRLWLVTRGGQPGVDGAEPLSAVAQAPLWGLGLVVALEHPELRCTRVDLDPNGPDEDVAEALIAELASPDDQEGQLAYRGHERRARRLVPAHLPPPGLPALRADGSYLVTGGLGGLGLLVAEWLAERGAGHLVLAGRRGPSAAARESLARLEGAGVRVTALQADVAREADVARLLAAAGTQLRGVVHAAGVLDDGVLVQQRWDRFASVAAPKVAGSWLLHRLTGELDLDFFVLFSSGASVLGSPGQANHAAANAFLDALAVARHQLGLPATSVNWGPWAELGAAVRHLRAQQPGAADAIAPAEGLEALERILTPPGRAQVAVLPINWDAVGAGDGRGQPPALLAELAGAPRRERPAAEPAPTSRPVGLRARLGAAAPNRRRRVLEDHVRTVAGEVLRLDPERLDPERPLSELGLDSLMAVELRNALGAALGRTLPATLLFEQPTVRAVAGYLDGAVRSPAGGRDTEESRNDAPADADARSVDEVARLLRQKLDTIS